MGNTHDDFSIPAGMDYDRSFGADRHDLRTHPLEQEPAGLIGIARRILRREPATPSNGAALSRVAGSAPRGRDVNLRS